MTVMREERIIVGPEDVLRVILQCKCGAEMVLKVDDGRPLPETCPMCEGDWKYNTSVQDAIEFLRDLQKLRRMPDAPVRVRLVFNGEAAHAVALVRVRLQ